MLATLLFFGIAAVQVDSYVGQRFVGTPEGLTDVGGAMITELDPYGDGIVTTDFSISEFRDGERSMLFLSKIVDRTEVGRAVFEVLDVEEVPELPFGVDILLLPTCSENGDFDSKVFPAIACEGEKAVGEVEFLWRATLEQGKLERLARDHWVCECIVGPEQ